MTLDRTIAPNIHDAIDFDYKLPAINTQILDNGIPLYHLSYGVQEIVEIDWVFNAGSWYEAQPGVANAVAALLKNGTSRHNAEQINEALEFYGAQLKVNAGSDFLTVSLYTLSKHLPVLLPIIHEVLTDCLFPQTELEIYKANAIQRLSVNLRKCDFVANQHIDELLFGDSHPYGQYAKKEHYENLLRENLLAFYHAKYLLSDVKIFMAGKVGAKEVDALNKVFGCFAIEKNIEQAITHKLDSSKTKKHHIALEGNSVQGAIRIGRLFPNRPHPDYTPMVILNSLLGGYFGSRLMSNIREDKGYTYGIHSSILPEKNGCSLLIQTETGNEVIALAIEEIYKEMNLLMEEPADEEELLLVKNYILGNMLGDLDGPFSILKRWRTLILNGFDETYFNNNISIYKSVTAKELQTLAQKYLNKEDFYELVVV